MHSPSDSHDNWSCSNISLGRLMFAAAQVTASVAEQDAGTTYIHAPAEVQVSASESTATAAHATRSVATQVPGRSSPLAAV